MNRKKFHLVKIVAALEAFAILCLAIVLVWKTDAPPPKTFCPHYHLI